MGTNRNGGTVLTWNGGRADKCTRLESERVHSPGGSNPSRSAPRVRDLYPEFRRVFYTPSVTNCVIIESGSSSRSTKRAQRAMSRTKPSNGGTLRKPQPPNLEPDCRVTHLGPFVSDNATTAGCHTAHKFSGANTVVLELCRYSSCL